MAKGQRGREGREEREDVAPGAPPEIQGPRSGQPGHDFTLQAVMEMQRTLGGLENKIDNVDRHLTAIAADVSKHGKWIYAATVVAVLTLGGFGFLAKVMWDIVKAKMGIP
jgi:hypothetical protein